MRARCCIRSTMRCSRACSFSGLAPCITRPARATWRRSAGSLNVFVSEWLVYVGLFRAAQTADVLRLAALGVPALALIGALALACFAKVSGVVFLGHARSTAASGAHEVSRGL